MQTIRQSLDNILKSNDKSKIVQEISYGALKATEVEKAKSLGFHYYQGKVRELLKKDNFLHIIHSDRLSAFDRHVGLVPYKGQILSELSKYWLEKSSEVMKTHLISEPCERVLKVNYHEPIKAEIIVRGYLAGSMARAYEKGERNFCGEVLDDDLVPFGPLRTPILTPTTKSEHDENTTGDELIETGIVSKEEWQHIRKKAFELFELGQKVYNSHGWILVDTKYEMGRDGNGNIVLIDEIHTPDSSRLWVKESYDQLVSSGKPPKMFDKENVRRYLIEKGFMGEGDIPEVPAEVLISLASTYLEVAEKLIGRELIASSNDISSKIFS